MSGFDPFRRDIDDFYDSKLEARFFKDNPHVQPRDGSIQIGAKWTDAWKSKPQAGEPIEDPENPYYVENHD